MNFQPEAHNGAPKRSNSGREIVYLFPNASTGGSVVNTSPPSHENMPPDVAQALELLRNYSFRDVYRWLKMDRQDEINHSSGAMHRPHSTFNGPNHAPRMSVASSTQGSSRASSVFSAGAKRISIASTNTTFSHLSDRGQQTVNPGWEATLPVNGARQSSLQTAHVVSLNRQNSATLVSSPVVKSARPSIVNTTPVRPSPRQRESDVEAKKKYFCTACNKGFARKYDWKVHEQRYHEQQTQYPCPDCNQILFAETLFKSHHRDAHGCQDCPHAKGIAKEVDVRRKRTAWGCGFCSEMLDDWEKRCDHVAAHYDNGVKREEWDHSKVIIGLLRQPEIDQEWRLLLTSRHGQFPTDLGLRFSKEATGRSHGENAAQLQDLLEFGACPRDIKAIVELAYEHGYRRPVSAAPSSSQPTQTQSTSLMSPPFSVNQDASMESPVNQTTQSEDASPMQFVAQTTNSSPMDGFDMNVTASMAAYQTPAESRVSSVGPAMSATITNPLDWSTYQMFPEQYTMNPPNPTRMSVSYDKPLPQIPPEDGRNSVTPRPQQQQRVQHVAEQMQQFVPESDPAFETWSLMNASLGDDPQYFATAHQFV
ncbi:uncharacterized protein PV09_09079 [Verruconis gallopava]|uniref:C2H2-type domain-containing protein n=1 Tax=Verruconis gallopava TaxID=253628 RepID=A0A0D1XAJ1_9PEZI|nr:uncharacterized protein PV09_09079 [Verruconis gallopava]KIV99215.1 hypothetical protein PV09_09079 [Verruconis gallopava]